MKRFVDFSAIFFYPRATMKDTYSEIVLPDFPLYKKGKVRDVYEVGDNLLVIASDRISAFDYVLPSLIPNKGKILTQLSKFWFEFTSLVCPNHMLTADIRGYPPELQTFKDLIDKRSMLVKKTEVLPVECVVRGYLEGSGWRDYKATGKTS
jgi:phosphoribosylaminoimidazole-succinocarboxamide synthase